MRKDRHVRKACMYWPTSYSDPRGKNRYIASVFLHAFRRGFIKWSLKATCECQFMGVYTLFWAATQFPRANWYNWSITLGDWHCNYKSVLSKDRLHFCRAVKSFELIEFNNAFCEAILWSESVTSSSGLNVAILSFFYVVIVFRLTLQCHCSY